MGVDQSLWRSWLWFGVWSVSMGSPWIVRADEPAEGEVTAQVQVIVTDSSGDSSDKSSGKASSKALEAQGEAEAEVTAELTIEPKPKPEPGGESGGSGREVERKPRWLGVQMGQVPEMLRKHLKLGENSGVLVISVMPKSPGEQAGLETHDVIVELAGERVEGPASLARLVQQTEGDVALTVIRAGERRVVRVQPVPWPDDLPLDVVRDVRSGGKLDRMIIQGLGPIVIRRQGEGTGDGRKELHLHVQQGPDGPELRMPESRPQFDVLVTPAPGGSETKVEAGELRADRLFFVNPDGGGQMQVRPLPPGAGPERWDRLEKSLDRLNEVLEKLEKKLAD
ncbi:MAG: PDZ domain-containing protein [Pirellulales bacterium]